MNKIAVLGGNGFIGRHLVKSLAKTYTSDSVVVLDRFSAYQVGTAHPFHDYKNVRIVPGNFFNRDDVVNVIKEATYVFHLISSTTPATSSSDPFIDIDTNIRSSIELFNMCTEHNVRKIIFFSSGGSVYGDTDNRSITESVVPMPRSPYAIGKLTIENYLRYFQYACGLEYIIYRVANPYGPGQNINGKQGAIPIFMNKLLHGEPVTVFGDGSMVRDYFYIDDLIEMVMGSFTKNSKESVYNIGSGTGTSVNDLVATLEAVTGIKARKQYMKPPPTYVHQIVLNVDRFVKEFGIRPSISLKEGIQKTWNYVKEL